MPYRVQRIEEFVQQLESGDLKLRVRVLEVYIFNHVLNSRLLNYSNLANNTISLVKLRNITLVMGILVWKSSKESNNTSDGNDLYRDGRYPFESWYHPELSRQPSCCERIVRRGRWALFRCRRIVSSSLKLLILPSIVWWNAGVFMALVLRCMQRVKRLDKFETMIWFLTLQTP